MALDATRICPPNAVAEVVLAHGAGADHNHKNMESIARAFERVDLATFRFNFPYMQMGKRRVDRTPVAVEAVADAIAAAAEGSSLPLFAGGHSFGGRMVSHAAAQGRIENRIDCPGHISGLVFCSFPLHQPKKPSTERAAHLTEVDVPMLFLSGTRDDLADPQLLEEVTGKLADTRLHWLETANHSYTILKRTRTNPLDVFDEMAQETRRFVDQLL